MAKKTKPEKPVITQIKPESLPTGVLAKFMRQAATAPVPDIPPELVAAHDVRKCIYLAVADRLDAYQLMVDLGKAIGTGEEVHHRHVPLDGKTDWKALAYQTIQEMKEQTTVVVPTTRTTSAARKAAQEGKEYDFSKGERGKYARLAGNEVAKALGSEPDPNPRFARIRKLTPTRKKKASR